MTTFKMSFDKETGILTIGFNPEMPASNDVITKDANTLAKEISSQVAGTKLLKITGAASLPVAMLISHAFCHLVQAIACIDPKLGQFVVCVSHAADHKIGDLV